jgi:transcription initiation factor TFIIIB Brf1 subunit/transcription initiation factor TFIIB
MSDFALLDRAVSARKAESIPAGSPPIISTKKRISERESVSAQKDNLTETNQNKAHIKESNGHLSYKSKKGKCGDVTVCVHKNIIDDNDVKLCTDCGREICRAMSFEKEWRWYGRDKDTRHSDPNRCHLRKTDDRTIYSDVAGLGFTDKIVAEANKIYQQVTRGNIYRANSRRAIIFACIFHAYKLQGHPQTCTDLMHIFKLDRKVGLKGLKHISKRAPKGSPLRTTYITPSDFISPIMSRFNATKKEIEEVTAMCEELKNRSRILNRARPQSVASGLIYFYCRLKNKDISMQKFIEEADLSELTVRKIATEIKTIRGMPEITL